MNIQKRFNGALVKDFLLILLGIVLGRLLDKDIISNIFYIILVIIIFYLLLTEIMGQPILILTNIYLRFRNKQHCDKKWKSIEGSIEKILSSFLETDFYLKKSVELAQLHSNNSIIIASGKNELAKYLSDELKGQNDNMETSNMEYSRIQTRLGIGNGWRIKSGSQPVTDEWYLKQYTISMNEGQEATKDTYDVIIGKLDFPNATKTEGVTHVEYALADKYYKARVKAEYVKSKITISIFYYETGGIPPAPESHSSEWHKITKKIYETVMIVKKRNKYKKYSAKISSKRVTATRQKDINQNETIKIDVHPLVILNGSTSISELLKDLSARFLDY